MNSPRSRSPTYLDCHNQRDFVTLEEFEANSDIVYIWDGVRWYCYDRDALLESLKDNHNTHMARWIGSSDPTQRGGPSSHDSDQFYRMPDGYYISLNSYIVLHDSQNKYFQKLILYTQVPIGNIQGNYLVSSLHGQSRYDIFDLVPVSENSDYDVEEDIKINFDDLVESVDDFAHTTDSPTDAEITEYIDLLTEHWALNSNVPLSHIPHLRVRLGEEFHRLYHSSVRK